MLSVRLLVRFLPLDGTKEDKYCVKMNCKNFIDPLTLRQVDGISGVLRTNWFV